MEPHNVTLATQKHMPRQQGLISRGTRWHSNFKVPLDLQAALGKKMIRESLGTSDYREACRKVVFERARMTALFDNERRKLVVLKAPPAKSEKRLLTVISEREAYHMAARYLATFEHKFGKWMDEESRFLEPYEREEMRSNVQDDEYDLARGEEFRGVPLDGTHELQQFLKGEKHRMRSDKPRFPVPPPAVFQGAHGVFGPLSRHAKGRHCEREGSSFQRRAFSFAGHG